MKKTIFLFILLLVIAMFLSSCFTIPKTFKFAFDESSEQNATVTFISDTKKGYFILNEWNAIDMQKNLYGERKISSVDKAVLSVPAGMNNFRFEMRFTFSNQYSSTTYRLEDIGIQYNLEAGEKYAVKGRYKFLGFLGFGGTDFYVGIYNVTKSSTLLEEWKVGSSK